MAASDDSDSDPENLEQAHRFESLLQGRQSRAPRLDFAPAPLPGPSVDDLVTSLDQLGQLDLDDIPVDEVAWEQQQEELAKQKQREILVEVDFLPAFAGRQQQQQVAHAPSQPPPPGRSGAGFIFSDKSGRRMMHNPYLFLGGEDPRNLQAELRPGSGLAMGLDAEIQEILPSFQPQLAGPVNLPNFDVDAEVEERRRLDDDVPSSSDEEEDAEEDRRENQSLEWSDDDDASESEF